jgi:hypothetical protein
VNGILRFIASAEKVKVEENGGARFAHNERK